MNSSSTSGPPVKCGYCGWLIQGCQNIMQHKCLEHYDEDHHLLNVDDNFIITLINRRDDMQNPISQDIINSSPDTDELLIQAVLARPGLYNIKLPVKDRTKLKKEALLWLEVSHTLGGILTPEAAKKRWQYLRDCFIKEKNKQKKYRPSGSAAGESKKPAFRFYEQMSFLCDSLPSLQTMSNIDPSPVSDDNGCSTSTWPNPTVDSRTAVPPGGPLSAPSISPHNPLLPDLLEVSPSLPRMSTPGGKKRKIDDSNAELRSALVASLQQPIPQPDAVDGFLSRLGEGLRRIPYRERAILEIKYLTMLMEVEEMLNP